MVAIFTGLGAGFERGSANILGGAGQVGSALLGRANESVSVNAATGNLLITQQDEFLVGLGPDVGISRTYNSAQDAADGDNGDQWQQSTTRKVFGLTGTLNATGSTISRLGADGAVIVYTWNATRSAYLSKDGAGAFDTLVKSGAEWVWTDGDTQAKEYYAAAVAAGEYRIRSVEDLDGNALSFTYVASTDKLDKVTTQDGSWTQYSWSGNNITQVVTGYTDLATSTAKTLTRVRYAYDGSNRLSTVTIDKTPNDNSVADNVKYVTTYTYVSTSKRIASITQTDGSSLAVTYDGSNRVATLTQTVASGVTRVTTLGYNTGYTTITGPDGQVTRLDYDASKRLTKITAPPATSGATAQEVSFTYDANGNVSAVTTVMPGTDLVTNYGYDTYGNTTSITTVMPGDDLVVTRWYDTGNRLITERTYGANESSADAAHYAQFAYDSEGHLRFAVSASGQVTEYRYNTAGQLSLTLAYAENTYSVGASAITEAGMASWVAGLGTVVSAKVTENIYDARGNLLKTTTFSDLNINRAGNSEFAGTAGWFVAYDPVGIASGSPYSGSANGKEYIGLNVSTTTADQWTSIANTDPYRVKLTGGELLTVQAGVELTGVIGHARLSVHFYDAAGAYVSSANSAAVNGNQPFGTLLTGVLAVPATAVQMRFELYVQSSGAGTGSFKLIEPMVAQAFEGQTSNPAYTPTLGGFLAADDTSAGSSFSRTFYVYDQAGNLLERYRPGENHETFLYDGMGRLYSSTDKNGGTVTIVFDDANTKTLVTSTGSGLTTQTYNKSGELIATTTAAGYDIPSSSAYQYDSAGRLRVASTAFYQNPDLTVYQDVRNTYFYYDKAGRKVAEVNHLGELTEYRYDAANRLVATIAYSTPITGTALTNMANPAYTGDLSTMLPAAQATDVWSWTVYDDAGRVRQVIDNLGSTAVYEYDKSGRLVKTTAYYNQLSAGTLSGFKTAFPTAVTLPTTHAKDAVSRTFYNKAGQLVGTLDGEGYLTETVYDSAGYAIRTVGYVTATNPANRASGSFTTLKSGLASATADRASRSVYDGQGLLRYTVNAQGGITGFSYDDAGRLIKTTAYANQLTLSDFTYDAVKAAVTTNAADRTSWIVYDAAGRAAYTIDAEGGVTAFKYNTSRQVTKAVAYDNLYTTGTLPPLATMDSWAANTAQANDSSNRITRNYYGAQGTLRFTIDAENYVTYFNYDSQYRVIETRRYGVALAATDATTIDTIANTVFPSSNFISTLHSYDGAGRVLTVTDGEGAVTRSTYNALGQLTDVTAAHGTADAVTTHYTYDGAGRVLTETGAYGTADAATIIYAYDGLGNRTSVTDARGNATTFTYDKLGQVLTATNALSGVTTYVYDAFGNVAKATNPGGTSTYNYYDNLNRLTLSVDALKYITAISYNRFGEVGSTRTYKTPFAGTPAVGTPPSTSGLGTAVLLSTLTYDRLGRVTAKADAEGYVETSAYDAFGQLVSFSRYEMSVYGSYGSQAGAVQEAFAEAEQLQTQADALAAVAAAADAALAAALAAKTAAQTAYNTAQAAATASAAAAASAQAQVTQLQAQVAAAPATAALASPIPHLQTYKTSLQSQLGALQSEISAHYAYMAGLSYQEQYYYYLGIVMPLETQVSVFQAQIAAVDAQITSIQGGGSLSPTYYNIVLAGVGYSPQQIADYQALLSSLAAAQSSAATAQATATADATAAANALTALNQATTAHGQAASAATAANNAANAAQTAANAAVAIAQQLVTEFLGGSGQLPAYTLGELDGAATTTFEYDRRGSLKKSTDAEGFHESYTYDAFGRRVTATAKSSAAKPASPTPVPAGGTTTYEYYKNGLLKSELLPVLASNSAGTETYAIKTTYTYDARGNMLGKVEWEGTTAKRTTTFTYDKLDRLKTTTGDPIATAATIDPSTKALSLQYSAAPIETITYDANGNAITIIDAAGAKTVVFYDQLNRKTVEINALGTYTAYTYGADGNVANIKIYETPASVPADGGPSSSQPAAPAGAKRETSFTYDARGQMLTSTVVLPTGYKTGTWNGTAWSNDGTTALTTTYQYDYLGNVVKVTDPNGNATYAYYDRLGRKFSQIDAENYRTDWSYDSDGNVRVERRLVTQLSGTPSVAVPSTGLYHANDRVTEYTYDKVGNRLSEARLGVVVHNGSGGTSTVTSTITYRYNGLGQVVQKNEATDNGDAGQIGDESFYYTYDAGGRLIQETRPVFVSNNGSNVSPQLNYAYDALGNLVRSEQAAGGDATTARVTRHNYGAGGRLGETIDADGKSRFYLYDVAGRLVLEYYSRTITNTDGTTIASLEGIGYRYDAQGRNLGQAFYKSTDAGATWVFQSGNDYTTIKYNSFGDAVATASNRTDAQIASLGYQQEFKYDEAGRLWATNSGDGVWKYFGYDKNGNQTVAVTSAGANFSGISANSRFDPALFAGATAISRTDVNATYTVYDKRNMAASVVEEGRELNTSGTNQLTTGRSYNAFGEVASESNAAGATVTYSYNSMGRMVRSESPTVSITLEDGTTRYVRPSEDYYYDKSGRLVATRDANGSYATGGSSGNGTSKAADTGNLTRLTLLAGTGYGGSQAQIVRQTSADGGITENFYNIFGDVRTSRVLVSGNGSSPGSDVWLTTTQTFDNLGRLLTATRPGGYLTDTYTYDILGQQVTHTNSLYQALHTSNKEYTTYDIQGRIVATRGWGGIGTATPGDVTTYSYTWDGTLEAAGTGLTDTGGWSKLTTYYEGSNSLVIKQATEKADLFGRAVQKTDMGAHVTNFTYDLAGRLTQSAIGSTSYNYQYYNTGQIKEASSNAANWYYTSSSTTATVGGSTTSNQTASYTYDAVGNRLTEIGTLTSGGTPIIFKNHTATWDALGRMTSDTMSANSVQSGGSVVFEYDANGNVRRKRSTFHYLTAEGGFSTGGNTKDAWYRYDNMNRVVVNNGQIAGGQIVLGLPVSADFLGDPSQSILYDKAGRRTQAITNKYYDVYIPAQQTPYGGFPGGSYTYLAATPEEYVYDAGGRLSQINVTGHSFDSQGYLLAMIYAGMGGGWAPPEPFVSYNPSATTYAQYGYDAMGRQTSLTSGATYNTTTSFNAKGQVTGTFASTIKTDGKTYTQTVTNNLGTGAAYALGSVVSFTSVDTVTGQSTKTSSTTNAYQWWDGAVQSTITYDSDTGSGSNPIWTTTFTYNGLGQLTKTQINDGQPRTVTFTLDEIGQIIRRDETRPSNAPSQQVGSPHELWFRMGEREIGYIGNNGGEDPTTIGSYDDLRKVPGSGTFRLGSTSARNNIGFAQALDPININEQGSTAGGYTVRSGDTLEGLAQRLYGDAGLWYKIAEVNGLSGGANLIAGQQIQLPSGVTRNTYTSDSYRPYDPAQAMGDLSPSTPKPAKKPKCGVLGQILLAAIAIGLSIWLGPQMAKLFSFLGTVGGAMAGGAVAGAAGSVASQTVGVITGIQDKFSFKAVGLAAIGGAVGGGLKGLGELGGKLGDVGKFLGNGTFEAGFVNGAVSGAITQGIGVATGLQDKFSWAGVAASAAGGGVGNWVGDHTGSLGKFGSDLASSTAGAIANAATRSAITGDSFGDALKAAIPDAIGQAIGRALGGALSGGGRAKASLAEAAANSEQAQGNPVAGTGSVGLLVIERQERRPPVGGSARYADGGEGGEWVIAPGQAMPENVGQDDISFVGPANSPEEYEQRASAWEALARDPKFGSVSARNAAYNRHQAELMRNGQLERSAIAEDIEPEIVVVANRESSGSSGYRFAPVYDEATLQQRAANFGASRPFVESYRHAWLSDPDNKKVHDRLTAEAERMAILIAAEQRKLDHQVLLAVTAPAVIAAGIVGGVAAAPTVGTVVLTNAARFSAASGIAGEFITGVPLTVPVAGTGTGAALLSAAEDVAVWNRLGTVGRTPGKSSATGRAVIDRMRAQGSIIDDPLRGTMFKASDEQWYPLKYGDMSHTTDVVSWWNAGGRGFGVKAPEVRQWMLNSNNYVIDFYSINRSAGARLGNSGVRYLPPTK